MKFVAGAALAVAVLGGCASESVTPRVEEPPAEADLVLRTWTGDRVPALEGCDVELTFESGGMVMGAVEGERFGGEYRTDGERLTVELAPGASGGRCQAAMSDVLAGTTKYKVEGRRLMLQTRGSDEPVEFVTDNSSASTLAPSLIGLSDSYAKRVVETNGLGYRVAEIDGEGQMLTMDYSTSRINVKVRSGVVIAADIG